MVNQIYPPELQLNKANNTDTESAFLCLHLSISNEFVPFKFYENRDDIDFDIVKFPFLNGDVPLMVYTIRILLCLQSCCGLQRAK